MTRKSNAPQHGPVGKELLSTPWPDREFSEAPLFQVDPASTRGHSTGNALRCIPMYTLLASIHITELKPVIRSRHLSPGREALTDTHPGLAQVDLMARISAPSHPPILKKALQPGDSDDCTCTLWRCEHVMVPGKRLYNFP